jgi:SAM-dependent methyltransferase
MSQEKDIKAAVQDRYARAIQRPGSGCCGGSATDAMKGTLVKIAGYRDEDLAALPSDAVENAFGCGNPVAFAEVREGEVVVDIGSGAGIDCLFAAQKVGPAGKVIGIDMTPDMIERARENARAAGAANVEFRLGDAEHMPLPDASADWIISNCVINLSPDKPAVFREIARVLKPGGRISISDIVAEDLPPAVRASRDAWVTCLAGAISETEYVQGLRAAGLVDVQVTERIAYAPEKLEGLFGTSACGPECGALAPEDVRAATGKVWSARFIGRKSS